MYDQNPSRYVRWLRRLSIVPRWVCIPTLLPQSVMDHTGQVCMITRVLLDCHAQGADYYFRTRCYEYAIEHDMDEAAEGDAPGPSKAPKDYKTLISERGQVYALVKLADLIDAHMFAIEDSLRGNSHHMHTVIKSTRKEVARCATHFTPVNSDDFVRTMGLLVDSAQTNVHPVLEKLDATE